jgi:hypothetical protein
MKYIITDRELREIARVVGEEARRPLLELIRNLMREMQAVAQDMAELGNELNASGHDDARRRLRLVTEIFPSSASRGRPVVPHRALAGW